jgi:predicted alpha/beta superfamily hydrolase
LRLDNTAEETLSSPARQYVNTVKSTSRGICPAIGRLIPGLAALGLLLGPAAAGPPAAPTLQPAQIALAEQFDTVSKITGRAYRIDISRPTAPPPLTGYPVVYVLDGDTSFPIVARQLRDATKPAVLVVGIAYPESARASVLRLRDMSPTQPNAHSLPMVGDGRVPDDFGGADAFHRFMIEELRPAIARLKPVDASRQSLMGYSLGGLFALHVMFNHPEAYQSLVISSPSIWWNDRDVLKDEGKFIAAVRTGKASPRILITSDQWEQGDGDPNLPPPGPDRVQRVKLLDDARMVDNAGELAARLKALKGGPGYEVKYTVFAEESHGTGTAAAASRGANFLYPH